MILVALIVVAGLNPWERVREKDIGVEEEVYREHLHKVAFLKREGLSSAGALASEDIELARLLSSDPTHCERVVDAISWYDKIGTAS